jgi:hypothetical protein
MDENLKLLSNRNSKPSENRGCAQMVDAVSFLTRGALEAVLANGKSGGGSLLFVLSHISK